jgi:hypothetical protein
MRMAAMAAMTTKPNRPPRFFNPASRSITATSLDTFSPRTSRPLPLCWHLQMSH